MNWFIWKSEYVPGYCVIEPPEIEDDWELDDGKPREEGFPKDAACQMDAEFPYDIQLADNLHGAGYPVVSAKLKDAVQQVVSENRVEYLPVRIVNHKGRVAASCFIVHPLDIVDCIDTGKSGVEWNRISAGLISACEGMVLRENSIPPHFKLFRPRYWGSEIFAREDLVEALAATGASGLKFVPAAGYTGME